MALLNISQASRASGKDRNTIKRYLKIGRLSCSNDENGKVMIDSAELMRVFGKLVSDGATDAPCTTSEDSSDSHNLTIATLVQQLKAAEEREKAGLEREAWLKTQLELEREHSRELERRMLPPAEKKGFWARVFGN